MSDTMHDAATVNANASANANANAGVSESAFEQKSARGDWTKSLTVDAGHSIAALSQMDGKIIGACFVVAPGRLATDYNAAEALGWRSGMVRFGQGDALKVRVVAYDARADVALLESESAFDPACKPLVLANNTSHKTNNLACLTLGAGGDVQVLSGLLRGVKFDSRLAIILRLTGAEPLVGSPIFNEQGCVVGLFSQRSRGLDKAAAVEHLQALMQALTHAAPSMAPGKTVLKVQSRVGTDFAAVHEARQHGSTSLLHEELELMRTDNSYRELMSRKLAVKIEQTTVIAV